MTMSGDASFPLIGLNAVTRQPRHSSLDKGAFKAAPMARIHPGFPDGIGTYAATKARCGLPLDQARKPDARMMLAHTVAR